MATIKNMKLNIEITETKDGNMAVRLQRLEGMGTNLELAYADAITGLVKKAVPIIGQKLGGKGLIGGEPKGN